MVRVAASITSMKVLTPAECLFVARSHPTMAPRISVITILSIAEPIVKLDDQSPRIEAMGSEASWRSDGT